MKWHTLPIPLALLAIAPAAAAETITVSPDDGYAPIEAAQPGDTVLLEPGTYDFRLHLSQQGTPEAPIVIRAADPSQPPVWDLSGTLVEDAPGSYTGGDAGRGCWRIDGASYHISGVVFRGCRTSGGNSAGIRTVDSDGVIIRDALFEQNDNGFLGTGEDTVIEFSEFRDNGNVAAENPTHNVYVYGGTFTLRHSYLHDPVEGQNFHIRARDSVLEYNWFARAKTFEGNLMTSDSDGAGDQHMMLRGNVFVGHDDPVNHSQVIAIYNDAGAAGVRLAVTALSNTFVVRTHGDPAILHILNDSMDGSTVRMSNNIVAGTTLAYEVEDPSRGNYDVSGESNWLVSGSDPGVLTGTVFGDTPGFKNEPGGDFSLAADSACIGAASPQSAGPVAEVLPTEADSMRYRPRKTANDIGAFESTTTGAGIGPYDDPAAPGPNPGDGPSASADPSTPEAEIVYGSSNGCSVATTSAASNAAWLLLLTPLLLRRRRAA